MPRTRQTVVLRPPIPVMQPVLARTLPPEDGLPGGVQYTPKWDGYRVLACVQEDHAPLLLSRRGTVLNSRYPSVLPAIADLPVGLVLDAELCAWTPRPGGGPGRLGFHALARTAGARAEAGTQLVIVAFDVLAVPGRDVRSAPLRERWDLLSLIMIGARPQIQQSMETRSLAEAQQWYRDLEPLGIEGVCAKGLDTVYTTSGGNAPGRWIKVRHAETIDCLVAGVTGSLARPEAVLVQLPDGRQEVTSPRLTTAQAHQVAGAVAGRLRPATAGRARVHWIAEPLPVAEVRIGTGRHGGVRFVRLRPEE
ncbi:DNA ligase [Kitasatospora sp. NPDC085879]|uniref:ATP-dependent DNA ligase n=1 Tax=Kitasatospora sp. NPDC085879 TaxID=3154769 RepID=UPI000BCC4C15|nr:DNA ligase [Streptomyces sp. TLI_235]PBC69855.1 ATP-dependent DNA ligase [Streptomyces sp. TLI_235]